MNFTDPDQHRILVIERNDITRKLIVGILHGRGYHTIEARDGLAAFEHLKQEPSLIIADVEDESVLEGGLLRKLQVDNTYLPFIATTSETDMAEIADRFHIKRMTVLEKPVMPEALIHHVSEHIATSEKILRSEGKIKHVSFERRDPEARNAREKFMRRAIDISQEKMDQNCGGPFGAVIVRNGQIIAEGWNEVTSLKDPTAHAEMQAIRKAAASIDDFKLDGCEIYTSCEPCPMCLAALYWSRIDRIFYANTREDAEKIGFDDDFIFREFALPEDKRTLSARMMLRDEAQIVFENWINKPDKTTY